MDGCVNGELTTTGDLFIGEQAEINAQIRAGSLVIAGVVKGSIIALEHIELRPTAKVKGDLNSPALVIHEGARLEGQCSINHVAALEEPEVRAADAGELGSAKVSFFITERQKAELRARGYDDATISKMKPAEAHKILGII